MLTPFDRISALAYGGFDTATLVSVAREAVLAEPVVVHIAGDDTAIAFGHTFIEVGDAGRGDDRARAHRAA